MSAENEVTRTDILTVRAYLDDALLGLRAIADPMVRVRQAESELTAALTHTYRALAASGDYRVFHVETTSALERTRDALAVLQEESTSDAGTGEELRLVMQALRALKSLGFAVLENKPSIPRVEDAKPILRATVDVPALLDLQRNAIRPSIPLLANPTPPVSSPPSEPAPSPVITTMDELEARLTAALAVLDAMDERQQRTDEHKIPSPPRVPVVTDQDAEREHFGMVMSRDAILFERARCCMEDLAMLSTMRRPIEGEGHSWSGRARAEQRLLARIDAIVACEIGVFPRLVKLLEERPLPDPDLTWAGLFLFGSIAGDDALDQVSRLTATADLSADGMADSLADALSFAPHAGINMTLYPWLSHPNATGRRVAIEALARRRQLSSKDANMALLDQDETVVAVATRSLATLDDEVDAFMFDRLFRHPAETVVREALVSACVRRFDNGVRFAQTLTEEGHSAFADAAMFVALGSRAEGLAVLARAASIAVSTCLIEALGWFGDLNAVDFLLNCLSHEVPTIRTAATLALQRLTDASLTKTCLDPQYEPNDRPFVRDYKVPTEVEILSEDPVVWAHWWNSHRSNAQPNTRYRFGHAWSAIDDLWELNYSLSSTRNREFAWLELIMRTGGTIGFDARDFVARQRVQIVQWEAFLSAKRERTVPGAWPVRFES